MSKKLRELQARKHQHLEAKNAAIKLAQAVADKAAADARDMTEAEQAEFAKHRDLAKASATQAEQVQAQIDLEQDRIATEAQLGQPAAGRISGGEDQRVNDPKRGFASFGEFARNVRQASFQGNRPDERLLIGAAAPSTFGGDGVGQDGGFLVPPEFAGNIFTLSLGEDALLPLTDNTEVSGNSMVFPRDETTPWGTDGVRAYWQSEASAGTPAKPKLGTSTLRLHKLLALVPITDELLSDTAALDGYLPGLTARSIRWKTNDAIINGLGNGQPVGIVNSGAVVTVSKDGSQAANTLSITNLANMMAQLPPDSYGSAVWLIHNTVLGALFSLNSSGFPYYLPFGSGRGPLADSPFGSLLGRPVIITQHAAAFSSLGDVQLVDFKYYRTITKAGGIQTATSMHLYFDADATAFRATFRVDGQAKIANAITQAKGTPKLSPFLQLQAR